MKTFPASKVESTGADKVILPTDRIGLLKRDDTYYVFEQGDEQAMASMLEPPPEEVNLEEKWKQGEAAWRAEVEALKGKAKEGKLTGPEVQQVLALIMERIGL